MSQLQEHSFIARIFAIWQQYFVILPQNLIDMQENPRILLRAVSPTLKYMGGITLQNPHSFSIAAGKMYTIIGENGCGKTTLGNIIANGWNFTTNVIEGDKKNLAIKSVEFSDIHALTGFSGAYYQQRFESMMNDDIPTVRELIAEKIAPEVWQQMTEHLNVTDILDKRINYLSSGELRKFLLINILTSRPDILIIDNPYIGLDADSRILFDALLRDVIADGTSIIMLLCNPNEIPEFTDFVIPMQHLSIGETMAVNSQNFSQVVQSTMQLFSCHRSINALPEWQVPCEISFDRAFELDHCNVMYGNNVILRDVEWTVRRGEKWALLGENGSGKSTLLSLVCCDNPQGYCNDITIFGHRRGTGESIWDIKRHISYISPEMHLYFNGNKQVIEVVASGLHDMKGLYLRASAAQRDMAMQWMEAFGIDHLANRRFSTLSSGEQRLVLLARTLIRQSPLLILDEPLHGLDMAQKHWVKSVIEHISASPQLTLIYVTHYTHEIPQSVNRTFTLTKFRNSKR